MVAHYNKPNFENKFLINLYRIMKIVMYINLDLPV